MQLLVAVKERQSRVVRNEIDFRFLVTSQHQHVFQDSGGGFSCNAGQLKTMPVKMDRVDVITGVAHMNAIALAFLKVKGRRSHGGVWKRHSVDGPLIEAFFRGVLLFNQHFKGFVGRLGSRSGLGKMGVVPKELRRRDPLCFTGATGVLDHNAHAVPPIVVGEIAHRPDARDDSFRRWRKFVRRYRATAPALPTGFGTGFPSSATTRNEWPGSARLRISVALQFKT